MTSQIFMTPDAVEAAREFRRENFEYSQLDLRIYLSGKGCDGFDYGVSFDSASQGDLKFEIAQDLTLICDEQSIEFLTGSTVTWVDDERGRGFVVDNPNHKKYRGKFYRRASWKNSRPQQSTNSDSQI